MDLPVSNAVLQVNANSRKRKLNIPTRVIAALGGIFSLLMVVLLIQFIYSRDDGWVLKDKKHSYEIVFPDTWVERVDQTQSTHTVVLQEKRYGSDDPEIFIDVVPLESMIRGELVQLQDAANGMYMNVNDTRVMKVKQIPVSSCSAVMTFSHHVELAERPRHDVWCVREDDVINIRLTAGTIHILDTFTSEFERIVKSMQVK
jgi:hypothetical protein